MILSIIMPVHNAGEYLHRSIQSIQAQTMTDWELIFIDDGSTDDSVLIAKKYAADDSRIKVYAFPERGYGKTMNAALDLCEGDYIADLDPDDWIEPDMYEKMIDLIGYDCDFVQCGYIFELPDNVRVPSMQNNTEAFCPRELPIEQRCNFFGLQPALWSRVYRRTFLENNRIRFHETPGAAFQDTAWIFKCNCLAQRVKIIDRCFYHYNRCNTNSSTLKQDSPFACSVEFRYMHEFLNTRPELAIKTRASLIRLQFGSYMWNYFRIKESDRKDFAKLMQQDLLAVWEFVDVRMFSEKDINVYRLICGDVDTFTELVKKGEADEG